MHFITFAFLFFNAMVFAQESHFSDSDKSYENVAETRVSSVKELVKLYFQQAENGDLEAQFWISEIYQWAMPDTPKNVRLRVEWLRLAASQGHVKAQYNLGVRYHKGLGVKQNYRKAFHFYELAAKQGLDRAQRNLAFLYREGLGVEQDYKKAHYFYQLAAQQGDVMAQGELGFLYQNGLGVEKDYKKAFDFYRQAAKQGYFPAQYYIGLMYHEGLGVEKDYKKAFDFYQQAAERGYFPAQYNIELMYYEGVDVEQDLKHFTYFNALKDVAETRVSSVEEQECYFLLGGNKAIESQIWPAEVYSRMRPGTPEYAEQERTWFQLLDRKGHVEAQYNLGVRYHKGLGVKQNYKKAFHFYELAAKQGLDRAQRNLAFLYSVGLYVAQDYKKAHYFYQLAAQQGDAAAQSELGFLYQYGLGVEKDYKKAFDFYQRAVRQKHVLAQYYTGLMYQKGLGIEQDLKQAAHFYELAARQGHTQAQSALVPLYKDLQDGVSSHFWHIVSLENEDKTKSIKGKTLKQKLRRFFLARKLDKEQKQHLKTRLQEWYDGIKKVGKNSQNKH